MMKSMRVLIIDEKAKALVRGVLDFSLQEENWYEPGISPQAPGDNPRHLASLDTCRCVFSITRASDGELFRHLSVSVSPGRYYLNPFAFYTIAQEFGFTGWDGKNINPPKDWSIDVNRENNCAVAIQRYQPRNCF
jgi:hypothetical protein